MSDNTIRYSSINSALCKILVTTFIQLSLFSLKIQIDKQLFLLYDLFHTVIEIIIFSFYVTLFQNSSLRMRVQKFRFHFLQSKRPFNNTIFAVLRFLNKELNCRQVSRIGYSNNPYVGKGEDIMSYSNFLLSFPMKPWNFCSTPNGNHSKPNMFYSMLKEKRLRPEVGVSPWNVRHLTSSICEWCQTFTFGKALAITRTLVW
jgi:hypothetical protein